jgi:hypothetical protein
VYYHLIYHHRILVYKTTDEKDLKRDITGFNKISGALGRHFERQMKEAGPINTA